MKIDRLLLLLVGLLLAGWGCNSAPYRIKVVKESVFTTKTGIIDDSKVVYIAEDGSTCETHKNVPVGTKLECQWLTPEAEERKK
jgi:hypothetical protein